MHKFNNYLKTLITSTGTARLFKHMRGMLQVANIFTPHYITCEKELVINIIF